MGLRHARRKDQEQSWRGDDRENPAGSTDLRRQIQGRRTMPAGSGRVERLDPFSLPVRFACSDKAADERLRVVELSRERVVVHRAVGGIKMAVRMPVASYLGVAIRMEPPEGASAGAVAVMLEHRDPGLSLPLYRAADGEDILAEWQSWAKALDLPLLVAEQDGHLREPFVRIGAVRIGLVRARRRRRTALRRRRPSLPLRRHSAMAAERVVHRGEREIIARN
jgi:hypothetical protein